MHLCTGIRKSEKSRLEPEEDCQELTRQYSHGMMTMES